MINLMQKTKKSNLKKVANKVAESGFGNILHEHNLVHLLSHFKFHKHNSLTDTMPDAQALARLLDELGPGFVELGRIIASRSDIVPVQYQNTLLNLKHTAQSLSAREVGNIIQKQFGKKSSKVFTEIDLDEHKINLTSTTYKAILDDGKRVLVTISNPKEIKLLNENLKNIKWIMNWILPNLDKQKEMLYKQVWEELEIRALGLLDLTQVAGKVEILQANFEDNKKAIIPEVIWDHTNKNILTQRWHKLNDFHDIREGSGKAGVARKYVVRYALEAMVKQYAIAGTFLLRPQLSNWQVVEKNNIVFNHFLETGFLEPIDRKKFIALIYFILMKRQELAGKILLNLHYEVSGHQISGESGLILSKNKISSLSESLWDILERGWQGNLSIPLGITMAAESILYLENAITHFDEEIDFVDSMKMAIKNQVVEIFGVKKNASVDDIVSQVLI